MSQTQLKIGDTIKAVQYGQLLIGPVTEITNNGCFIDCEGLNFAHRDNITHINGKSIK